MNLKKIRTAAALFAAMAVMAASGCGETETSSSSVAEETSSEITTEATTTTEAPTEEATEEQIGIIGVEQKGDAVCIVTLLNDTGKDIAEFSVKKSDDEDYPENMIANGVFENDEERVLYYESGEWEYSVKIVFDDDSEAELHNFPFDDIAEGTIKLEGETAYLVYTSVADNVEVNTKEDELEFASGGDTEVQEDTTAATQAPVVTEPPAPTEPVTEAPVVTDPPATEAPVVTEPATADPNEGCIGDGALFW